MRYRFSQWTLDINNYQLFCSGNAVAIRPKTLQLLAYLVQNAQRLVTREEVLSRVWLGRCVCDESLTTCIKEIRKILGDTDKNKKYIVTRHGLGYQFIEPVYPQDQRDDMAYAASHRYTAAEPVAALP